MSWRRTAVVVAAIVSCLAVSDVVFGFVVEWAWFSAIGYLDVFWTTFRAMALLFLTVFAASAILIGWNGWLASRLAKKGTGRSLEPAGGIVHTPPWAVVPDVPR